MIRDDSVQVLLLLLLLLPLVAAITTMTTTKGHIRVILIFGKRPSPIADAVAAIITRVIFFAGTSCCR